MVSRKARAACAASALAALAPVALGSAGRQSQTSGAAVSPDELLLKDYRPNPIYRIPQTRIEKARFPVTDVHSHPYAHTPEQVEEWVRNMDAVGVTRSIVMVGATGKAFDDAVALYGKYPERFELWCGFDLSGFGQPGFVEKAVAELDRCARAGARGVGELGDKGRGMGATGMHVDDARLAPLFRRCAELRLPVNIHVGEDRWMYEPMDRSNDGLMNAFKWKIPEDPSVLRHQEVIDTLDRAVAANPRTTFIACHLANCCYDLSILGRMLDAHPNLYADIGARYAEIAPIPRSVGKFFDKSQDRLLYGTDMGFKKEMYRTTFRILETEDEHFYDWNLFTYHWPLHGLGLKERILKKVYADNAARILNGRIRKAKRS